LSFAHRETFLRHIPVPTQRGFLLATVTAYQWYFVYLLHKDAGRQNTPRPPVVTS